MVERARNFICCSLWRLAQHGKAAASQGQMRHLRGSSLFRYGFSASVGDIDVSSHRGTLVWLLVALGTNGLLIIGVDRVLAE